MSFILSDIIDSVLQASDESQQLLLQWKCQRLNRKRTLVPKLRKLNKSDKTPGIHQIEVLKQHKNDSCGYFSVWNLITLSMASLVESDELSQKLIEASLSPSLFWKRYFEMTSLLHVKVKDNERENDGMSWYPWTLKDVDEGVLERSYMVYLLEHDPWFSCMRSFLPFNKVPQESPISFGEDDSPFGFSVFPEFSLHTLIRNGLQCRNALQLEKIFARFKNRESYLHGFLLGQTNHWICLILNKIDGELETLLLDSKNTVLIGATDEDLWDVIKKSDESGMSEELKQLYFDSMKDTQYCTFLFNDCALGKKDIVDELLHMNLSGFFDNFEQHTKSNLRKSQNQLVNEESSSDEWICLFLCWLENWYPPAVIEANIKNGISHIGMHRLRKEHREWFSAWTKHLDSKLNFAQLDLPTLTRFKETLQWFMKHF